MLGARLSMFLMFTISVGGSFGLIFVFDSDNTTLLTIFVGIAKFGISASFSMVFICFMELIPTIFVATLFGYGNFTARMVTVLAPEIAQIKGVLPQIITLVLACIGAVSCLLIKQKLPRFV